jgi:hypothetical protein
MWPTFTQPLEVIDVGSEVAGRVVTWGHLHGQRELEGVQVFASGGEPSDA